MSNQILSNEVYVTEGGARVRTRCLKAHVTDAMIEKLAALNNLAPGDHVLVQCMNHARDTVYWERAYGVASRDTFLKQTENARGDVHTAEAHVSTAVPLTEWKAWAKEPKAEAAAEPEKPAAKKGETDKKAA